MKFKENINIENNIVNYELKAEYNEVPTDDELAEIESLHDYVRKIKFAEIDFTANIDISSGKPVVTSDEIGDKITEVSLGKIAQKEYILDERLVISFSVDAGRISDSEVNDVLPTKALVSQSKIAVFQYKIKEKILNLLDEIRNEDNNFEQETETIL